LDNAQPSLPSPTDFGPVDYVMRQALPQQAFAWRHLTIPIAAVVLMLMLFFIPNTGITLLAALIIFVVMGQIGKSLLQQRQLAHKQLQVVQELVRLRHWPQACAALRDVLSRPAVDDHYYLNSLNLWAILKLRYHEFELAGDILKHMVGDLPSRFPHPVFSGAAAIPLRTMIAWTYLRSDRLVDFDDELSRTRKQIKELEASYSDQEPPSFVHSMRAEFALVEMYRDIMTHHAKEAVALFQKHEAAMRSTLGRRLACPLALVAHAKLVLNDPNAAKQFFTDAKLLLSEDELRRIYPELSPQLSHLA
jgi:hypothetical protein